MMKDENNVIEMKTELVTEYYTEEEIVEYYETNGTDLVYDPIYELIDEGLPLLNRVIACKGTLKDGKKDGLWEWNFPSDKEYLDTNYKDGKKDGLETEYYEAGETLRTTNWKDDERDGVETTYFDNGDIESETNWKDGKKDGLETEYFMWWETEDQEGDQKKSETNWKDGKEVGKPTLWDENGQRLS